MFHVELAPLGGIFGPLKSDLGVFWPFRGTDFIMGKNKNANFSKRAHGPIFKFCVVICEAILQKNGTNLRPSEFFFGFDPFRRLCKIINVPNEKIDILNESQTFQSKERHRPQTLSRPKEM